MNILVTGGAGFIGCNFVRYLLEHLPDAQVRVLDKLTYAGSRDNLADVGGDPRVTIVEGDICDVEVVREAMSGVDVVVHLAAESHVDRSILGPQPAMQTNFHGTFVLLEAARQTQPDLFLHVSTDEVYGPVETGQFDEAAPLAPRNPYSASKAGADHLAQAYYVTYDVPVIITRPCNNYGPYQYPEKLVPLFVYKALRDEPLPVYGDGRQRRDWLHVTDHCRAMHVLLEKGEVGQVYNIPADSERENLETIRVILDELGKPDSLIKHVADRPGHDIRYAMSGEKISNLGWQPQIPGEEGLRQTVRWFADHQDWLERSLARSREYFEEWYKERR